jgi:hypothetical protein
MSPSTNKNILSVFIIFFGLFLIASFFNKVGIYEGMTGENSEPPNEKQNLTKSFQY